MFMIRLLLSWHEQLYCTADTIDYLSTAALYQAINSSVDRRCMYHLPMSCVTGTKYHFTFTFKPLIISYVRQYLHIEHILLLGHIVPCTKHSQSSH